MDKRQFKALIGVNLRLLNPQVTDRFRKRGLTGTALTKKLTNQFYLNTFIFILIYGFSIMMLDLSKMPGTFTFYVGLFLLLGFSQSLSGIYNVFFAGKDLADYLPLPLREQAIFLSKIFIVSLNVVPFTLPLLIVFALTAWRAGIFIVFAVLMALLVYALLMGSVLCLCALIVLGLTKTKLFQAHQNVVMNLLMGVTMVIAVGGILLMNNNGATTTLDHAVITPFLPLFNLFTAATSVTSLLTWVVLLGIFGGLAVLTRLYGLNHLVDQLTQVNTVVVSHAHSGKPRQHDLLKILRRYNLSLLKEPNLLFQIFTNSVMMPLIFVITFAFTGADNTFKQLPLKWFGVFFVGGLALTTVTVNQMSLVANLISLDKLNFAFVTALPVSMNKYLRRKFWLGYEVQMGINVLMALVIILAYGVPPLLALALLVGLTIGTYGMCQHYFRRDYQQRLDNWTNVTQLFNRGGGNMALAANLFASLFISGLVLGLYGIAVSFLAATTLLNIAVLTVVLIIVGSLIRNEHVKFWRPLT